jgi:hypothetical protein
MRYYPKSTRATRVEWTWKKSDMQQTQFTALDWRCKERSGKLNTAAVESGISVTY